MFSLRDLGGIPVCTRGDLVGILVFPPWHVRRNCMNPHVCALISSQCFGIIVLTLKPSTISEGGSLQVLTEQEGP